MRRTVLSFIASSASLIISVLFGIGLFSIPEGTLTWYQTAGLSIGFIGSLFSVAIWGAAFGLTLSDIDD